MRFMVIVKGSPDSEAGKMPPPEVFKEMGKFNEEMAKAGVMLAGEGLHPNSKGAARIRFDGKQRTVIDGPTSSSARSNNGPRPVSPSVPVRRSADEDRPLQRGAHRVRTRGAAHAERARAHAARGRAKDVLDRLARQR